MSNVNLKQDEYEHLKDVVGALMISQFNSPEEYRRIINQIFNQYIPPWEAANDPD